jgi:D-tyrosyl-tRNA(Tyr) deacylase
MTTYDYYALLFEYTVDIREQTIQRNSLKLIRFVANMERSIKAGFMRSVVQRVDRAKVLIGDRQISGIDRGLLILLGIEQGDREDDAAYLADKIMNLRIFEDDCGKMNLSLLDIRGEMLVVSQFTLLGDCRRGRRPSFTTAESPDRARMLCDYFVRRTKDKIGHVAEGMFQAMMRIELVNNGPVTMLLDSRRIL